MTYDVRPADSTPTRMPRPCLPDEGNRPVSSLALAVLIAVYLRRR
ncbi:hypothetical protein [Streptomyces sp. NPDC058623]